MKVCYFGTYEQKYPRNSVLISGLRKAGVDVFECHIPLWEKKDDKTKLSFSDKLGIAARLPFIYAKLSSKFRKLRKKNDFDCIIVGYIGQLDMFAARLAAGKQKIIFNPMISLYDTLVNDRKMFKNFLIKRFLHWIDRKSCEKSDLVLLDTEEHADYFRKEFGLKNVDVLYVGAEDIFRPMEARAAKKPGIGEKGRFKVLYYGKYTPLHGTRYVIEAAKILEPHHEITFEIVGKGQTHDDDIAFAKKIGVRNIKFVDWVDYQKLPQKIAEADVCLGGHFGKGEKAIRVVPNKVFQMIAMGKPVVVNGGPAMREAGFRDRVNCVFCKVADPKSIAESILLLKKDPGLADRIAKCALDLHAKNFSDKKIGVSLVKLINQV